MADHIMQYFRYEHLPAKLQEVSKPFADMARVIEQTIPRNPERTAGLRKLLEAKDSIVRAALATPESDLEAGEPVDALRFNR